LGSLLQACGGGGGGGGVVTNLKSLTIEPVNSSIAAGTQLQLHATGHYKNKTTKDLTDKVTWISAATNVANVSNTAGTQGLTSAASVGVTTITVKLHGKKGVSTFRVTNATLTSITVHPVNPFVAKGTTLQMAAQGNFSDGSVQDLTTQVIWSSVNAGIAQVSNVAATIGLVTGLASGNTPIAATLNGTSGATTVTVTAAALTSISITVPNASIAKGTSAQLTTTCNFSDGTTQDCTSQSSCTSSDTGIVQVSGTSPGLITGIGVGSTSVTCAFSGVQGSAKQNVTSATLTSIAITPPNPSVPVGIPQQLLAKGTFSDSSTQDLTTQVSWSQDDNTIAQVSNVPGTQGLLTGLTVGSTSITAFLNGISGSTTASVTAAILTSLTVTAPFNSVPAGTTRLPLTATCNFSDNTTRPCTGTVSWSTSDNSIAQMSSISPTQGQVTGIKVGSVSVIATLNGIQGTATINVTDAVLQTITVSPKDTTLPTPPVIANGFRLQLVATCNYSDGTALDCTTGVNWSSANDMIATVSNATGSEGLINSLAVAPGIVITATDPVTLIQGTITVTITDATLSSITVSPATSTIPNGLTTPLTATCNYSDGSHPSCTTQVNWSALPDGIVTVNASGMVTGTAEGTVTITAEKGGVMGTASVVVTAAVLQSITVAPTSFTIAKGLTKQLTATCNYSDGTGPDCTSLVSWTATPMGIVTVSPTGLVTGTAIGNATVIAFKDTITSNSAAVTVTSAVVQKITITPASLTLSKNEKVQMMAIGTLSDGTLVDLTAQVDWQSSDDNVAHIINSESSQTNGELTARNLAATGTTIITGTLVLPDGTTVQGQTTVTVLPG